jgi:8-oxo-dGTP pyrophosphatase MutT (NUDIX family)
VNWFPHVTVAAMIEDPSRFLMVEEVDGAELVLNQPAGHLEDGETLLAAVARETLEETRYGFVPNALLGVYRWRHPDSGHTYIRFAFRGTAIGPDQRRSLDHGILRAAWFSADEIRLHRMRSPLVLRCLDDYLAGRTYPLQLLTDPIPL